MADTKRDIRQKIKNQAKQIEAYANFDMGARLSDANFITYATALAASITTEIGALAAAAP